MSITNGTLHGHSHGICICVLCVSQTAALPCHIMSIRSLRHCRHACCKLFLCISTVGMCTCSADIGKQDANMSASVLVFSAIALCCHQHPGADIACMLAEQVFGCSMQVNTSSLAIWSRNRSILLETVTCSCHRQEPEAVPDQDLDRIRLQHA